MEKEKRQVVIKGVEVEFVLHSDNEYEGGLTFECYNDAPCRYPATSRFGVAALNEKFTEICCAIFSIFPVPNSAFISGQKVEIELCGNKLLSIKSLETGKIFDAAR